jgi:hypothetical protein
MCTYIYIYIRKWEKREKEKKRISRLNGPQGFSAQSSAHARPAQLGPPTGHDAGTTPWAWAHTPARGRGTMSRWKRRSARGGEEPAADDLDDGSSPMIRFWVVGVVA